MSKIELKPCPFCGAKLKSKVFRLMNSTKQRHTISLANTAGVRLLSDIFTQTKRQESVQEKKP